MEVNSFVGNAMPNWGVVEKTVLGVVSASTKVDENRVYLYSSV